MARLNVLLIVVLILAFVIAFNPQARVQALNGWEVLRPFFAGIKEGLTVILHDITNKVSDAPSDDRPPTDAGPIYNL